MKTKAKIDQEFDDDFKNAEAADREHLKQKAHNFKIADEEQTAKTVEQHRSRPKEYDSKFLDYVEHDKTFIQITFEMLVSPQWQCLTLGERNVYVACVSESRSKMGSGLYVQYVTKVLGLDLCEHKAFDNFVFPAEHQKIFGLQPSYTSRALKSLEQKGFIEKWAVGHVSSEKAKMSVYKFSGKWKTL